MRWHILQLILKFIISLTPVGLFFAFYFKKFIFRRSWLISLAPFFWGIISSVLTVLLQSMLPQQVDNWLKAFMYAALIEESIRLLFMLLMIYMARETFTITEGIFNCIMIGLGFAFAENIHYALNVSGNIVFLRTISSVPLHVFASGIMGYYASYLFLNLDHNLEPHRRMVWNRRNITLALQTLLVPVLLHGIYDFCLLESGRLIYLVPLILIAGFIYVEYISDTGGMIFGRNILKMLKINADDVMIILRQQNYERWVSRRQKTTERPYILKHGWHLWKTLIAGLFFLTALTTGLLIYQETNLMLLQSGLSEPALIALLVLYPLTISIILLLDARINYGFFRAISSHVPLTALVNVKPAQVSTASAAASAKSVEASSTHELTPAEVEELEQFTFVMDILPTGVFLPLQGPWQPGQQVALEFVGHKQQTIFAAGRLQWANQHNTTLPLGYICRFESSSLAFWRFRFLYTLKKVLKVPRTYQKLIQQYD